MTTIADGSNALDLDMLPQGSTGVHFYRRVFDDLDVVARSVFAVATPCKLFMPNLAHLRHPAMPMGAQAPAAPVESAEVSRRAPVLQAVEELRAWLNVSYEDLARIFGWQSASTLHHWRRRAREGEPVRPRASAVEAVLRLHAVVHAVSDAVSGGDDPNAIQLWVRSPIFQDGPTPLQLLERGEIAMVERVAGDLLFDRSPTSIPAWRVARLQGDDILPPQRSAARYSAEDFG
jgi:transposase-like protein